MRRTGKAAREAVRNDVAAALAAMGAEELRDVICELMLELDDRTCRRVAGSIVSRAARGGSGWVPAAVDDSEVAEAVAFIESAEQAGYADPAEVDERLRRGTTAFLCKDYAAARRIFGAILGRIAEGELDLGQHEITDEVLGVDATECAVQYVVSVYMTSDPVRRAEAARAAIHEVGGAAYFFQPIPDMERAAVEPLPELDEFLLQWRATIEKEAAESRQGDWDRDIDGWLLEVVRRIGGAGGLASLARRTKHGGDLQAWCDSLVEAGDWKAALAAFEEAADLVADRGYARGKFLDGAALAAQELGKKDLSPWLERAWRAQPTMPRLCRWLGPARTRRSIRKRAGLALEECPNRARCQRTFLHLLQGDVEQAARLLAEAPGLGWSGDEHPGHLLFSLFQTLAGRNAPCSPELPDSGMGIEEFEFRTADGADRHLATPEVLDMLRRAGFERLREPRATKTMLAAMRKAAEKRVAEVTGQKRRRQYGHAASLVAACVACDGSPEAARWAAGLREQYRRFSAFRAELDRRLGRA